MTPPRSHAQILVVDDEPGMLHTVSRILARGHDVTCVESGFAALEAFPKARPDLAIVDIRMPGMTGFELTRQLKARDPNLDVILMTGNAEEPDDNLIRAIDEGAFYFIQKPFDRRVLLTLVTRCLELRRLRRAEQRHVQRLERELEEAREFQLSLLPERSYQVDGVSIHARYLACSELAGDIYDYAPAGKDAVAVLVADVVGHGASAAMMTSVVKTSFQSAAEDRFEPSAVIDRVKAGLRPFDASRFVTLVCARLDLLNGSLAYINAGHPAPIVISPSAEPRRLTSTGPMLSSTFYDLPYRRETVMLNRGDSLLLYTDGLTEAWNESDEMFGESRLIALVTRPESRGDALLSRIESELAAFAGGKPQADDITLLTLDWGV